MHNAPQTSKRLVRPFQAGCRRPGAPGRLPTDLLDDGDRHAMLTVWLPPLAHPHLIA
ncbi:hypothetical protein Aple_018520 [Acrocarpospora pleiomorpha]|uniref:Uncharacterized protein n=1 Tax=Acrocarpospora pleiomorpha TaxID=90975 RepID=A0A5M3XB89_9ACTN|nr:hypothetical protein [Acrocarpospora pleiomorpha]GES18957.1 hypothetical protein Aple_018520 [Acrocarpospora pleiomorpha]